MQISLFGKRSWINKLSKEETKKGSSTRFLLMYTCTLIILSTGGVFTIMA